MHLSLKKKKKTNLLEAEIYLKLQRLSEFLFLSIEVLFETQTHKECNQMALNRQMDKEDVVYIHRGMLLSHKKRM